MHEPKMANNYKKLLFCWKATTTDPWQRHIEKLQTTSFLTNLIAYAATNSFHSLPIVCSFKRVGCFVWPEAQLAGTRIFCLCGCIHA